MTQAMLVLIPLSLLLVAAATATVVWAVRSGQFEDLDTEARRILMDDPEPPREPPADGTDGTDGDGRATAPDREAHR